MEESIDLLRRWQQTDETECDATDKLLLRRGRSGSESAGFEQGEDELIDGMMVPGILPDRRRLDSRDRLKGPVWRRVNGPVAG